MAFSLPTFNLTCSVFTGPWLGKVHRFDVLGNLAFARRVAPIWFDTSLPQAYTGVFAPVLLLPALTDVRSNVSSGQFDVVEVPLGSDRWYAVEAVEDIGKGFPNEHRAAALGMINHTLDPVSLAGCVWPVPMP